MIFTVSQEVAADPATAFDAMADVRNEPRWNRRVSRSELLSSGAIAEGTRFKTVNRGYEYDAVITTYERPARLGFEVTGQQLDMSVSFRFEPAEANRTRIRSEFDMRPKGIMKLLFPLMTPLVRRDVLEQTASFGKLFEGRAS